MSRKLKKRKDCWKIKENSKKWKIKKKKGRKGKVKIADKTEETENKRCKEKNQKEKYQS